MNYSSKYFKGFSLIEILTATLLLTIVVAAAYATFLSVTKLSTFSRNELEAHTEASRWIEQVRAGFEYGDLTTKAYTDLNNPNSILREDYKNNWPFAKKPNVSNLNAKYSIVDNIDMGSHLIFRKVTIRVKWDETD